MLDTALKQIATMQPAQLPEVELPRVPDLSAAAPLAAIAHGNPAPLLESAKNIDLDKETISAALGQARTLVTGTIRDLVGIATQLLRQGLPTALGLLSLDPSTRAAAMAKLRALVSQHLGMATARVQRLMGDLSAAAQSLQPVAQRPVHSALADAPAHPTSSPHPHYPSGTTCGRRWSRRHGTRSALSLAHTRARGRRWFCRRSGCRRRREEPSGPALCMGRYRKRRL